MKRLIVLFFILFFSRVVAHPLPHIQTENIPLSPLEIFIEYLKLGFNHVVPSGADHILFILGIFFLNSNLKSVLIQCTVFTLAHSISLGLAASGIIVTYSNIVEPIIALSITFVAVENIYSDKVNLKRLIFIFCFGLIHGLGFASALSNTGLFPNYFILSLLSFNIGVELGQVTIILLAFFVITKNFREFEWYKKYVTNPISVLIGIVGLYWFIERLFN
jgi:hypothetical protein